MNAEELAARRADDAETRALAQREFGRPLLVQAGAGTGKTATLVARVLAWCLGPGWEKARDERSEDTDDAIAERVLRGIVAITFTEAAAAEMDMRIDRALRELSQGERPIGFDAKAPPERVHALRGALDQLVVQTIHAYCRRLLAAHPIEVGLHPLFEVDADGSAALEATRAAVAERLGDRYARGDDAALALGALGIGPLEIQQELAALRAGGALATDFEDVFSAPRIEAFARRLAAAHAALDAAGQGRFAQVNRGKNAKAVGRALAAALALLDSPPSGAAGLGPWIESLVAAWSECAATVSKWAKPDSFTKTEAEVFGDCGEPIQQASAVLGPLLKHLESIDVAGLAHLAPIAAEVAGDVEGRMRRGGRVGFEGLLSHAAMLLREHPAVAEQARRGIDQLLVDEFQDTDPRQCAIVAALALDAPAGERPGLFLVGDPKQSIYGWRNADLEAYEGLAGQVSAAGGSVCSLCVNHRSSPAILEEVERVVAPVMQHEPGVQPPFEPLVPSDQHASDAGFGEGGRAPVEHWLPLRVDPEGGEPEPMRVRDATTIEAAALARDMRELHDEHGVEWEDFGVLFRSRGDWDVYLGALRARGIPYLVEGDRTYYRRREIVDAASLVACVLDPNDGLALVAMLRSSAAGVPDAAWIPLWCEHGLEAIAKRLGDDPAAEVEARAALDAVAREVAAAHPECQHVPGWHAAAAAALENVAALRRAFTELAGDAFVERLRAAFCFEALEATRFAGAWRAANLEHFFSDLAARLAEGRPVAEVLRAVRAAVTEEETPSAEPAAPATRNAVTVSTLHGAKGLAWTHVYLMQLHKRESHHPRPGETGEVDGVREWRMCGRPTLGCEGLAVRRRRVAEAELVRMLYVGATRARRRLVFAGIPVAWQSARSDRSHTGLLARRRPAPPDVAALVRRARTTGGRVDEAETQWVFPALWPNAPDPVAAATAAETPAAPPPLAALPDTSARMARRARIAVTRLAAGADAAEPDDRAEREAEDESARLRPAGLGAHVGTAIHRALERLDLDADPEQEWARQRAWLSDELQRRAPPALAGRAAADAQDCWDALGAGPLAARLRGLAGRVVARELPLLLPLGDDDPADVATGAVDLLYRDADGTLVVADYKTDRALPDAKDAARRERYVRQGDLYRRAVAEALGSEPRVELWWLRAGEVEVLRRGGADAQGAG